MPSFTRITLIVGLATAFAASILVTSLSAAGPRATFAWQERPTGTTSGLRGVSAVSADVAWVSGSGGTVLRTLDGGATWENVAPLDADAQAFRDIEAFDADTAVLLAIGTGEASRLYRTDDGGETWTKTYQNTEPNGFYDCMSFFDRRRGLVLGDPVAASSRSSRPTTVAGPGRCCHPTACRPRCRASSRSPRAGRASRRPAAETPGSRRAATPSLASSTPTIAG